jgi:amino acid permease
MKDTYKIKMMLVIIAVISCFALLFSLINLDVRTENVYSGKIIKIESKKPYVVSDIPNGFTNMTCSPNVKLFTTSYYDYRLPEALYVEEREHGICVLIIKSERTVYDGRWKWEK